MCELLLELTLRMGTDFEPEPELEDFVSEDRMILELGKGLELLNEAVEVEVRNKGLELEYLLKHPLLLLEEDGCMLGLAARLALELELILELEPELAKANFTAAGSSG